MYDLFTTREIATGIWFIFILVYLLSQKKTRSSIYQLIKILLGKQLRTLLCIVIFYNILLSLIFSLNSLWKAHYIKDISIWMITSGVFTSFKACEKETDEKYALTVIKNNLSIAVLYEFMLNTFTFNLIVELIIIPAVFTVTLVSVFSDGKEEYKDVHWLSDTVLSIIGACILIGEFKIGLNGWRDINFVDSCISFIIPILYFICDIPLYFMIQIISLYQLIFSRMSIKDIPDENIKRKHRFQVIRCCKLSIKRGRYFLYNYVSRMYRLMDEGEFEIILEDFKSDLNYKKV